MSSAPYTVLNTLLARNTLVQRVSGSNIELDYVIKGRLEIGQFLTFKDEDTPMGGVLVAICGERLPLRLIVVNEQGFAQVLFTGGCESHPQPLIKKLSWSAYQEPTRPTWVEVLFVEPPVLIEAIGDPIEFFKDYQHAGFLLQDLLVKKNTILHEDFHYTHLNAQELNASISDTSIPIQKPPYGFSPMGYQIQKPPHEFSPLSYQIKNAQGEIVGFHQPGYPQHPMQYNGVGLARYQPNEPVHQHPHPHYQEKPNED
jgi:hypothetical protein